MTSEEIRFEPLPLPRREFVMVDAGRYWVRSSAGEAREIKANTAYEAFLKSGFKDAIRIERILNLNDAVVEKSKLAEEDVPAMQQADPRERLLRRESPVISAHELEELMRSLQEEAAAMEPEPTPAMAENVESEAASLVVPPPVSSPADALVPTDAIGLDVHGDGFDEIIPAAPVKPVSVRAAESSPAESRPAAEEATHAQEPPAQELSSEEVEKLLQGK